MPDWIAPIGLVAAILLLVGAGVWAGKVIERLKNLKETADKDRQTFKETAEADRQAFRKTADTDRDTFQQGAAEDRKRFREVLDEIREDIKKILRRLPPVEAAGSSPLRLTDLGHALSSDVGGGRLGDQNSPRPGRAD